MTKLILMLTAALLVTPAFANDERGNKRGHDDTEQGPTQGYEKPDHADSGATGGAAGTASGKGAEAGPGQGAYEGEGRFSLDLSD